MGSLHFYPGEKKLYWMNAGGVVKAYEAWGGPAARVAAETMDANPTSAGTFVIYGAQAYHTGTWPWSNIKWGTPLSDKGTDIWYRLPSGRWASLEKSIGITRTAVMDANNIYYGKRQVPPTWVFNDFGPIAIRYFRDTNGNNKLDANERLSGEMFHTTPDNEAQHAKGLRVTLAESHGCVHIKPADRDELSRVGAFRPGTRLVVHTYAERR